jgi:pantetheine hydrolase
MGSFICFDVLFEKPAIDLVEQYHINTALFPTAWQSKLPLMQGVGYHESWSTFTGVNLLSSELHIPANQYAGSGINVGGSGAVSYYFDGTPLSPPTLLISEVPVHPPKPADVELSPPKVVEEEFDVFDSIMRGDPFKFIALEWDSHEVFIEDKEVACYLQYKFLHRDTTELYALAVFEGLHMSAHNSYLQVCTVVKCGDINDRDSCGDSVSEAESSFSEFTLHGQFSTKYVFPSVIVDGAVPTGNMSDWDFTMDSDANRFIINFNSEDKPLVYAALYGRIFEKDSESDNNSAQPTAGVSKVLMLVAFIIGRVLFFGL